MAEAIPKANGFCRFSQLIATDSTHGIRESFPAHRMEGMISRKPTSDRYALVDALRGFAAFAVLFHHATLLPTTEAGMPNLVPACLLPFSTAGSLGVEVFFVLSGFVIAHSLSDSSLTVRELGRFMFRRQCRLDPPYWTVLLIILAQGMLRARISWVHSDPLPSFTTVATNLLYLQQLLGAPSMLGVAWTLCLEIQFYLFFLVLLRIGRPATPNLIPGRLGGAIVHLVFSTGILSLFLAQWPGGYQWFGRYWFYFVGGVLAYWTFQGFTSRGWFLTFLGCYLAALLRSFIFPMPHAGYLAQEALPLPLLLGFATAILLWWSGETHRIYSWSGGRVMQFLGRISYSLYLTHVLFCSAVLRLGHWLTGTNPLGGCCWILLAMAMSLIAAHVYYHFVERPSIRLASWVKTRPLFSSPAITVAELAYLEPGGSAATPALSRD
jgi:peptidoglycan/LPS O-acetylase OafA/YrhL